MTVTITITGENAAAAVKELCALVMPQAAVTTTAADAEPVAAVEAKPEPEKKARKAKEEKVAEPKAEVLAPEKPTYTLQDAIDRAREIAGDGKDEKIMNALKGINTRLGISKVREIPPEKLDGYMKELNAEFPKDAAKPADANMFD